MSIRKQQLPRGSYSTLQPCEARDDIMLSTHRYQPSSLARLWRALWAVMDYRISTQCGMGIDKQMSPKEELAWTDVLTQLYVLSLNANMETLQHRELTQLHPALALLQDDAFSHQLDELFKTKNSLGYRKTCPPKDIIKQQDKLSKAYELIRSLQEACHLSDSCYTFERPCRNRQENIQSWFDKIKEQHATIYVLRITILVNILPTSLSHATPFTGTIQEEMALVVEARKAISRLITKRQGIFNLLVGYHWTLQYHDDLGIHANMTFVFPADKASEGHRYVDLIQEALTHRGNGNVRICYKSGLSKGTRHRHPSRGIGDVILTRDDLHQVAIDIMLKEYYLKSLFIKLTLPTNIKLASFSLRKKS
ncbi:hypothetical protein HNP12_004533 [Aeromonas hydrophila]|uniref:hypothetical protein n=1 Tax=Aeromonas hydrophila TaxID=644 RepID=UPI002167409A|nr:hypothetical protein [Aeromonas hydrophila]MCS3770393.1 hypothetical protein [Aeromonas hydrophila]